MVIILLSVMAQRTLTLDECLRFGIEQNIGLAKKNNQIRFSREATKEARANLLPQINGYFNLNDNFNPQNSVVRSVAQDMMSVSEQLQYNAQTGVQISMPLYNQSLRTAVEVQKLLEDIDHMQYDKAREDLIMQISRLYYLGQMTAEQIRLTEGNIRRMDSLRSITKSMYDNQVALEIDVQRVDINLKNLKVKCENAESLLRQQMNTLKYIINCPSDEEIILQRMDVDAQPEVTIIGTSELLPELELLRSQIKVNEKQINLVKNGYLPTVSLTGGIMWNTFGDKFSGWLTGSGQYEKWYNQYGIGVQLNIPIFDGMSKRHKKNKAQINLENARLSLEDTRKNLRKEYLNSVSDFNNNSRTYHEQRISRHYIQI